MSSTTCAAVVTTVQAVASAGSWTVATASPGSDGASSEGPPHATTAERTPTSDVDRSRVLMLVVGLVQGMCRCLVSLERYRGHFRAGPRAFAAHHAPDP